MLFSKNSIKSTRLALITIQDNSALILLSPSMVYQTNERIDSLFNDFTFIEENNLSSLSLNKSGNFYVLFKNTKDFKEEVYRIFGFSVKEVNSKNDSKKRVFSHDSIKIQDLNNKNEWLPLYRTLTSVFNS